MVEYILEGFCARTKRRCCCDYLSDDAPVEPSKTKSLTALPQSNPEGVSSVSEDERENAKGTPDRQKSLDGERENAKPTPDRQGIPDGEGDPACETSFPDGEEVELLSYKEEFFRTRSKQANKTEVLPYAPENLAGIVRKENENSIGEPKKMISEQKGLQKMKISEKWDDKNLEEQYNDLLHKSGHMRKWRRERNRERGEGELMEDVKKFHETAAERLRDLGSNVTVRPLDFCDPNLSPTEIMVDTVIDAVRSSYMASDLTGKQFPSQDDVVDLDEERERQQHTRDARYSQVLRTHATQYVGA